MTIVLSHVLLNHVEVNNGCQIMIDMKFDIISMLVNWTRWEIVYPMGIATYFMFPIVTT